MTSTRKIIKLRKIKLSKNHPLIRVEYRSLFRSKERDVIKDRNFWRWADLGEIYLNDTLLNAFNESSELKYVLNAEQHDL